MKLKDIGEFGFIDRLKSKLKADKSVIYSIGEDAAVIKYNRDEYLLFASDMLIENVHFKISGQKDIFAKIGHKALACNISDIASMGGVPKYAVISLGLPPDLDYKKALEFFSGAQKLAGKFGINIVGGDLSRSEKVIVDVSLIGIVKKKNLTLRSGARSGDIIFVTGPLGGSCSGKHLTFTPRLKQAQYIIKKYKINSMIDISDGLAGDLWQIIKSSEKGAMLFKELLPITPGARNIKAALYEGEDFELLFTVSVKMAEKITKNKKLKVYAIGEILENRKIFDLVNKKGRRRKLKPGGYEHF